MSYPDDLLRLARSIVSHDAGSQAALRRSLSTSYYGLFHLLISEAAFNWKREELRPELGRLFQHGKMKDASNRQQAEIRQLLKGPDMLPGDRATLELLEIVAASFVEIQQKREEADYNTATIWTESQVLGHINEVERAFAAWREIRGEPPAQAYLLSLLGRR